MSGFDEMEVEGASDFLRLKSGEVATFSILSNTPEKSIIHWQNKKKLTCAGKECALCAEGDKPKQRWNISVWDRKEQKEKKFEFGASIAAQIKEIAQLQRETHKTIHDTDIRIKTSGSGLETEYTVLPVAPVAPVPQEVLTKYDRVPF